MMRKRTAVQRRMTLEDTTLKLNSVRVRLGFVRSCALGSSNPRNKVLFYYFIIYGCMAAARIY